MPSVLWGAPWGLSGCASPGCGQVAQLPLAGRTQMPALLILPPTCDLRVESGWSAGSAGSALDGDSLEDEAGSPVGQGASVLPGPVTVGLSASSLGLLEEREAGWGLRGGFAWPSQPTCLLGHVVPS